MWLPHLKESNSKTCVCVDWEMVHWTNVLSSERKQLHIGNGNGKYHTHALLKWAIRFLQYSSINKQSTTGINTQNDKKKRTEKQTYASMPRSGNIEPNEEKTWLLFATVPQCSVNFGGWNKKIIPKCKWTGFFMCHLLSFWLICVARPPLIHLIRSNGLWTPAAAISFRSHRDHTAHTSHIWTFCLS